MRKILICLAAILSALALGALAGAWSPLSAQATSGGANNGEFIVRCPMTGEVQAYDPILAPGGTSEHTHMFFGHYNVKPTSTAIGLRNQGPGSSVTTCEDGNDTAAYWAPESYLNGQAFLPGCAPPDHKGSNWSCGTDVGSTIYVRAYYLTTSGASTGQLPPGLIMVSGTPGATSAPTVMGHVYWDCGATAGVQTPESIWPYTCAEFGFSNNEGVTEIIDFPSCWDGNSSFTTPNGTAKVPGYFDPSLGVSTPSDLAYPPSTGGCSALNTPGVTYHPVPHLSLRIHYTGLGLGPQTIGGLDTLSTDSQTIYPSSCTGSTFANCATQQAMGQSVPPDDIGLQLSSDPSGAPGPWYTGHADYWQTWQQGQPLGPDPNTGTLNSLTYYCLVEAPQPDSCGFQPDPATGMFPPPPGS